MILSRLVRVVKYLESLKPVMFDYKNKTNFNKDMRKISCLYNRVLLDPLPQGTVPTVTSPNQWRSYAPDHVKCRSHDFY